MGRWWSTMDGPGLGVDLHEEMILDLREKRLRRLPTDLVTRRVGASQQAAGIDGLVDLLCSAAVVAVARRVPDRPAA